MSYSSINLTVARELESAAREYLLNGNDAALSTFSELFQDCASFGTAFSLTVMQILTKDQSELGTAFSEIEGGSLVLVPKSNNKISQYICASLGNGTPQVRVYGHYS